MLRKGLKASISRLVLASLNPLKNQVTKNLSRLRLAQSPVALALHSWRETSLLLPSRPEAVQSWLRLSLAGELGEKTAPRAVWRKPGLVAAYPAWSGKQTQRLLKNDRTGWPPAFFSSGICQVAIFEKTGDGIPIIFNMISLLWSPQQKHIPFFIGPNLHHISPMKICLVMSTPDQ